MSHANDTKLPRKKWWLHPMDPENLIELTDEERRNAKRLNRWFLIWGVMFFGTVLSLEPVSGGIDSTPFWRILLVLVTMITGVLFVHAAIRFYQNTKDELTQKIQSQALSVGFIAAFLVGMCFELIGVIWGPFENAGAIMFFGLISGYTATLVRQYQKYSD